MLFRRETLDGILRGQIDRAFRRWTRPAAKAGGRQRTAAGVVRIGAVTVIDAATLTEQDATKAGFETLAALRAMLGPDDGSPVYRIELLGIEPDERAGRRAAETLTDDDWAELARRFARWERQQPGYFPGILAAIEAGPGVAAARLAAAAGVEKLRFKQDVRRLKELGLTESLEVGYRIAPRGRAVLARLSLLSSWEKMGERGEVG